MKRLFDADAERRVLAALLARHLAHPQEWAELTLDLFAHGQNRAVAEAMIAVRAEGRGFHWKKVQGELRRRGRLDLSPYVGVLVRVLGTRSDLGADLRRLRSLRKRRRFARPVHQGVA